MSTTVPSMTFNSAGNIRSSASLAASGTDNANVDYSAKLWAYIHVKNTPGGSVAATRGLKIEIFDRYGSTPTTGDSAIIPFTLPSATASTAESTRIRLETGKYNIKITNLDASNAVTVEITGDTVDNLTTT